MSISASSLVVYVGLYSLGLAAAVSAGGFVGASCRARLAAVTAALLVLSIGFPPSPLFTLKLHLGGALAGLWGWHVVVFLVITMLVAWCALGSTLRDLLAPTPHQTRAKRSTRHLGLVCLVVVALLVLVSSPFGAATVVSWLG